MNMKIVSLSKAVNTLGVISVVYIIFSRFWKLDRGLIFSDEGWYVTLLRDNPTFNSPVRFYKLFQFGIQDDIYGMRLLTCVLILAAIAFFGYSVYRLQKSRGQKHSFLFCLSIVAFGSLQAHSISTPNYINLNLLFGLLSVSTCLLFVSATKDYLSVFTSFFASFLFITQVLGIILIPFLYVIILYCSNNKLKTSLSFAAGIVLFFCIFFLFIESPKELVDRLILQTQNVTSNHTGDYGIVFLIKWSLTSFSYIIKFLIAAILFCQGAKWVKQKIKHKKWAIALYAALFFAIIGYVNVFINPHCHANSLTSYNQLGICFFFAFLSIVAGWGKLNRADLLVSSLLLFTPFALCLGTNTEFLARYSTFLVFLLPVIFILTRPSDNIKRIALIYFAVTVVVSIATINKANWMGERPSDMNIPVKTIGIDQNLKLTDRNIKQLKFCQQNIKKDALCYSVSQTWGIVGLLDLTPARYEWNIMQPDMLSENINKQIGEHDIVIISSDRERFCHEELKLTNNIEHKNLSQDGIYLDFYMLK